jgi:hypothetical protein
LERFLLRRRGAGSRGDGGQDMKIYILLLLIGVIVGLSHLPIRRRKEATTPVPPDSLAA